VLRERLRVEAVSLSRSCLPAGSPSEERSAEGFAAPVTALLYQGGDCRARPTVAGWVCGNANGVTGVFGLARWPSPTGLRESREQDTALHCVSDGLDGWAIRVGTRSGFVARSHRKLRGRASAFPVRQPIESWSRHASRRATCRLPR